MAGTTNCDRSRSEKPSPISDLAFEYFSLFAGRFRGVGWRIAMKLHEAKSEIGLGNQIAICADETSVSLFAK